MNKYQNGKIYKIVDVGYNKCYIGSTCEKLSKRMAHHRQKHNAFLRNNSYFTSSFKLFQEFGLENCKIELIENYACECREELLRREGHYIKQNDCVNTVVAGRTDEEYRNDNREKVNEARRERYSRSKIEDKEKVIEQRREEYSRNKDKYKAYYEQNKERILEDKQIKIKCPACKREISKGFLTLHNKCNKHLKNLQAENQSYTC